MKITNKVIARELPRLKLLRRELAVMERDLTRRERLRQRLVDLVATIENTTAIIRGVAVRERRGRHDGRFTYNVTGVLNDRSAIVYESAQTRGIYGLTVYVVGKPERWYGLGWKRGEAVAAARSWVVENGSPNRED